MYIVELAGDFQQQHPVSTIKEMRQIVEYYKNEFKKAKMQWTQVAKNQINAFRHTGEVVQMTWTDDRPDKE